MIGTSSMKSITTFRREFEFLSNFYPATFIWNSYSWPTVEHAFQAAKTISDRDFLKVYRAETPGIAKHRGNSVTLRKDWEQIKLKIMTELVWLKFEQNPELLNRLLDTGSAELIEGNWWHDNFWG